MLINRKFKDESGVTILISMMVSVVVLMVCTIMVSAALSNAAQAKRALISEQNNLNITSAVAYLKEDLLNSTFTVRESQKTNINTDEVINDYKCIVDGNYLYNTWLANAFTALYDDATAEISGSFIVESEFADLADVNVEINFMRYDEMEDSFFELYATFKILNEDDDDINYVNLQAVGLIENIESEGGIAAEGADRFIVKNFDHILTFQAGNIHIDRNKAEVEE